MKILISHVCILLTVFIFSAQLSLAQSLTTDPDLPLVPTEIVPPGLTCGDTTITQSTSQTINIENSVSCIQDFTGFVAENSFYRAFDLETFGLETGKVAMDELLSHHDNFSLDGLSQQDLNNIRKAFESSDGDIDSVLQQKEILAVMDADRDGTVSKEELISFHELVAMSPRDVPEQFIMPVANVFSIQGRGTVVTGTIERGEVNIGDDVELVGFTDPISTTVTAIEMIGSPDMRSAGVGDTVGLLVRGVAREDARIGQVLATPGLTRAGQSFTANIMLKTSDDGGRISPIFTGYSPDFIIRTARVTGTVTFPEGLDILSPGESAENMQVQLKVPLAIEGDLNFELYEGGNVVGSATITEVTNN